MTPKPKPYVSIKKRTKAGHLELSFTELRLLKVTPYHTMVSAIIIVVSANPGCGKTEILRRSRRLSTKIRPQFSYRGPMTSGARDKGKKRWEPESKARDYHATLPPTPEQQTQPRPRSRQPRDLH